MVYTCSTFYSHWYSYYLVVKKIPTTTTMKKVTLNNNRIIISIGLLTLMILYNSLRMTSRLWSFSDFDDDNDVQHHQVEEEEGFNKKNNKNNQHNTNNKVTNHGDTTTTNASPIIRTRRKSTVRNNRLELYKQRYKYQPPIIPFTKKQGNEAQMEREKICHGQTEHPHYSSYFSLDEYQRSSSDEDKTIYELFFKDKFLNGEGGGGAAAAASSNLENSSGRENGMNIVELGAFTGIRESNSRFFEECLGWNTLLIEAMPKTFRKLKKNRPNVSC